MAVTKDEREFLAWWERNRDRRRRLGYGLWIGLPAGCMLAFPIFLNFLTGRFWYRRADAVGSSQFEPFVLVLAVALIAGFTGWIHSRMQWERNEERSRGIRSRMAAEDGQNTEGER
jgi:hypothetical protein